MEITYSDNWTTVANLALTRLNRPNISSLSDGTRDANLCLANLPEAIGVCVEMYDWSFLKKRVQLSQTVLADDLGYLYSYKLPADLGTLVRVETGLDHYEYKRIGDYIYTNSESVIVTYTALPSDIIPLPITFKNAISNYLAYLIAPVLSGDSNVATQLYQMFSSEIGQAMQNDGAHYHNDGADWWVK